MRENQWLEISNHSPKNCRFELSSVHTNYFVQQSQIPQMQSSDVTYRSLSEVSS